MSARKMQVTDKDAKNLLYILSKCDRQSFVRLSPFLFDALVQKLKDIEVGAEEKEYGLSMTYIKYLHDVVIGKPHELTPKQKARLLARTSKWIRAYDARRKV